MDMDYNDQNINYICQLTNNQINTKTHVQCNNKFSIQTQAL